MDKSYRKEFSSLILVFAKPKSLYCVKSYTIKVGS